VWYRSLLLHRHCPLSPCCTYSIVDGERVSSASSISLVVGTLTVWWLPLLIRLPLHPLSCNPRFQRFHWSTWRYRLYCTLGLLNAKSNTTAAPSVALAYSGYCWCTVIVHNRSCCTTAPLLWWKSHLLRQ
jgi:hypothetical protein